MNMHDNIYISTAAFKAKDLKNILDLCLKHKFYNLELGSKVNYSEDNPELMKKVDKSPMRFLVHNYFPRPKEDFVLNLASDNRDVIRKSVELCKRAIDLSSELHAPFYSVHAGYAFDAKPADLGGGLKEPKLIPYQKACEIFLEHIISLNYYAKRKGVRLLVENHVVTSSNLINGKNLLLLAASSRELIDLYKSVNSDNFGFLVDLAHLKISAEILQFDPYSFIDELGATVGAFHVSDNEGYDDSHSRFDEKAWFKDLTYAPGTIFIIESCNLGIEEIKKCQTHLVTILKEAEDEKRYSILRKRK